MHASAEPPLPNDFGRTPGSDGSASNPGSGQRRRLWTILLAVAVALPAVIEFAILYRQAFTIPYQDDYGAILAFAREYRHLPDWGAKVVDTLTKQNNDYKLVFAHVVVASNLELARHLNFAFFVALGDLFLLPLGYLLWRAYRPPPPSKLNQRLLEFLPISLMLFAPFYWETLDWSMAGLQNIPVILFSLLSILLLVPTGPGSDGLARCLLASTAAILAALSSANGFLLAPIGLLILIPRKAYLAAAVWCASFLLPIAAYLYHYVPYRGSVHVLRSGLWIERMIFYFFAFQGCAILNRWVAVILGLCLFALFVLSVRWRFDREHPIPFYFTLWVLATAALVGGMRGTIASRYSVYSALVFIYAYFVLATYLRGRVAAGTFRRFQIAAVACSVLFFAAGSVKGNQKLGERRAMVLAGMEHYRANPQVNSPIIDPNVLQLIPEEPEFERIELNKALDEDLLVLPSAPSEH